MPDQRILLAWARRVTLLAALAGVFYAVSRFEILEMPSDRCSPLLALAPGTTLVVDLRPGACKSGDVVFHEGDAGEIWIGRIDEVRDEGLWIVTDDDTCPVPDSELLGPVRSKRLRGRVVLSASW